MQSVLPSRAPVILGITHDILGKTKICDKCIPYKQAAPLWEGCPGLVDYAMITIKEPFIKNEESTKDIFIS